MQMKSRGLTTTIACLAVCAVGVPTALGTTTRKPVVRKVQVQDNFYSPIKVTIKQGQQVSFNVPAYPGESFHAPIARIAHDVDVNTRTMHVELDVENKNGRLAPGSFATVSWPVRRSVPTLFVPAGAITQDQQHTFVIRVSDNKAEWVNVQTGRASGTETEVFGNLHEGDQVVRTASDSIRNGQPVTVRTSK